MAADPRRGAALDGAFMAQRAVEHRVDRVGQAGRRRVQALGAELPRQRP
jgi:hypothetical protein